VERGLILLTIGTLALVVAAVACGAPAPTMPSDSPAAQATSVRRTAVAQVQQIIANNPTATPLPAATPTPVPTCRNAIWWTEARSHVGESRTIQGTIVGTRLAPGGITLLELGQPYPDPTGLALIVPSSSAAPDLGGKTVCATGRISLAEGRPTLQLRDPAAIAVVN
jgi:hypothetical protein